MYLYIYIFNTLVNWYTKLNGNVTRETILLGKIAMHRGVREGSVILYN